MSETKDLQVLQKFGALTVTEHDPRLPAIAQKLHLRKGTLLNQIQKFIPNPTEQQLYITIVTRGGDLRPARFAKIMREYHDTNLTLSALTVREVSRNIYFSLIDGLEDFLTSIQEVFASASLQEFSVSLKSAVQIAKTYGENSDKILDELLQNADDLLDRFGRKSRGGLQKAAGMVVDHFAKEVLPACQKAGLPAPVRVFDFFEEDGYAPARRLYLLKNKKGRLNIAPVDNYQDGVEKDNF